MGKRDICSQLTIIYTFVSVSILIIIVSVDLYLILTGPHLRAFANTSIHLKCILASERRFSTQNIILTLPSNRFLRESKPN